MKKIYNSRAFWAIVSLLASLAIWVYVTSMQADQFTHTFHNVRLELVGEDTLRDSKNMVITDLDTNVVTVELVGPRRIVASWDSSDIVARVDVSKLSRSAYTSQSYYLSYPDGTDATSISVNRKTPDTVSFLVSPLSHKTVQVRGSFDGSLAEGFTAETPVFEPSSITVSGPEAYIKNINHAWVSFGQDDISSTYKVDTGFVLMDENGEQCSTAGLSFSDDVITATLPILMVKDIPLSVEIIEGSGATKANTKLKIEPESITLAGDTAILSGINRIILDTIDLRDFSSTYTDTYTIPLDNELKNLTGITEATVKVEIVDLETRPFKVRNISFTNVTEGYEAVLISESIDVQIRGTAEQLDNLKEEHIRAVADLTDYNESTGNFMPVVKIVVDGIPDVGAVGEYTVSIVIRKA